MDAMLLTKLKRAVQEKAKSRRFIHHWWFVKYHLEIVEKIALELCERYPKADRDFVLLLVWLHDYGKIVNYKDQYKATLTAGKDMLFQIGFSEETVKKAIAFMSIFDAKEELDKAPLEIQIVSSADGASHLVGPFYEIFWKEFHEWDYDALLEENRRKLSIDWEKKIVLPEVKKAFALRYRYLMEQFDKLPKNYLTD